MLVLAFLTYYKYFNIDYPDNVRNMLQKTATSRVPLDFGIKMPQSWKESFIKRPVNDVFTRYRFHSSFVVNYWKTLLSMAFVVAFGALLYGFKLLMKKFKHPIAE